MLTAGMIQDVHVAPGFWSWPVLCVKANLIHFRMSWHQNTADWRGEKTKQNKVHTLEKDEISTSVLIFQCHNILLCFSAGRKEEVDNMNQKVAEQEYVDSTEREKKKWFLHEANFPALGCFVCEMQSGLQCVSHTAAGTDVHSCLSKLGPPDFPQASTRNVNVDV